MEATSSQEPCPCGGTGRTFDSEHRPVPCRPHTVERIERAQREMGWVPTCLTCGVPMTPGEYRRKVSRVVAAYGRLCAACGDSLDAAVVARINREKESSAA